MRISDWSSDVCSSDLVDLEDLQVAGAQDGQNVLVAAVDRDREVLARGRDAGPAVGRVADEVLDRWQRFGHCGTGEDEPSRENQGTEFRHCVLLPAPRRKNRNERVEFIQSPGDADDPGHVDAGVPANLPVPEKIEPGLRRARGPWSG